MHRGEYSELRTHADGQRRVVALGPLGRLGFIVVSERYGGVDILDDVEPETGVRLENAVVVAEELVVEGMVVEKRQVAAAEIVLGSFRWTRP